MERSQGEDGTVRVAATVNIATLAETLGISVNQAYELAAEDALPLPTIRVGRQLRFSRQLLDALLAGEYSRPTPQDEIARRTA